MHLVQDIVCLFVLTHIVPTVIYFHLFLVKVPAIDMQTKFLYLLQR